MLKLQGYYYLMQLIMLNVDLYFAELVFRVPKSQIQFR